MTRFFHQTMRQDDGLNDFVTDVFNITTIALTSLLAILTIAATI